MRRPAKQSVVLWFTKSFAACLVVPAFSFWKFFPAKRIGAQRSRIRAWAKSDKFLSSTSFRLVVIIMAVNDEKHLLHHILGAALHLQIINDKRGVLVKAGDKVSLVLREQPQTRSTVRNSGVRLTC